MFLSTTGMGIVIINVLLSIIMISVYYYHDDYGNYCNDEKFYGN